VTHFAYRWIRSQRRACIVLFLALSAASSIQAQPTAETETAKINFLLHSIESLEGAQFIRNGTSYASGEAVAHLRLKWRAAGAHVVTARDFIRECASKSSLSGVAYSILFADGHRVTSADFLTQQLAAYEREH
jgi:Family of unknown function (DUF5329)